MATQEAARSPPSPRFCPPGPPPRFLLLVYPNALGYHGARSEWEVAIVRYSNWLLLGVASLLLASGAACKRSEDAPAPQPSASAEPAPPPPAPAESVSAAPEVSAKPAPPVVTNVGGDISGCCSALKSSSAKAAAADKGAYAAAAAVCDGLAPKVKSGAVPVAGAKRTIRAQLQRAPSIPGACQ